MRAILLFFLFFAAVAEGAEGDEPKHLTAAPLNGSRPATLTALSIERGGQYPSTISLKGAVEIKQPICFFVGKRPKLTCNGSMILRADEATYQEETGEIEARGLVTVTHLRHETAKKD
jgi:hypothetical protein